ncbi:VOC family protein [Pseudonocardia sp. CA-107938]|uniref:VOC family protein n=1 Tax=Pseudonocardia sp. CA-107938 TaxID=3240021 RepID=UPI003D910E73
MASPITYSATVLGAPEGRALGRFYQRLLDWEVVSDEADWFMLRPPGGGAGLSFQTEKEHTPPTWPAGADEQQMQLHLDLQVTDLAAGSRHAEECGAVLAEFQPQENVRVYLDPAGHPFCLFVD